MGQLRPPLRSPGPGGSLIDFFERAVRIQADALAWQGGALTAGRRTVPLGEDQLRPVCRDLVLHGTARLGFTGPSGGTVAVKLTRPGHGRRPPGQGVLDDLVAVRRAGARASAGNSDPPGGADLLARLAGGLAEDLRIPLSVGRPESIDRARPAILAQALFDFCLEIERTRQVIARTLAEQADAAAPAPAAHRFTWTAGWRAECEVDGFATWGPVYQVFHRHGLVLTPFARAFAARREVTSAPIPPATLRRQAGYFSFSPE